MNWGMYGILVIFGLFVLLMIFNPKLSCFGKWIKSPLYPLFRKRKQKIKTDDYGFHLVDENSKRRLSKQKISEQKSKERKDKETKKTDDYGFRLN